MSDCPEHGSGGCGCNGRPYNGTAPFSEARANYLADIIFGPKPKTPRTDEERAEHEARQEEKPR